MAFNSGGNYSVKFDARRQKLSFQLQLQAQLVLDSESGDNYHGCATHPEKMASQASDWCLLDQMGRRFSLPHTMIFLGREECDITIQSRSVDKRHAVLTHDSYENKFKVKDLSSLNGTFVNDTRIPEQAYVTLENLDTVRFGYDPMVYRMERVEEVPSLEGGVLSPVTPDKLPAWAVQDKSPLAECQGCIAEQEIQHTCTFQDDLGSLSRVSHTCTAESNGHVHNVWQHSALYQHVHRPDSGHNKPGQQHGQSYVDTVIPVSSYSTSHQHSHRTESIAHHQQSPNANNQNSHMQTDGYLPQILATSSSYQQSRFVPGHVQHHQSRQFSHQNQSEAEQSSLTTAKSENKHPTNIQRDNYQSSHIRPSDNTRKESSVRIENKIPESFSQQQNSESSGVGHMQTNVRDYHAGSSSITHPVMNSIQLPHQITIPVEMVQNFHRSQIIHPAYSNRGNSNHGASSQVRLGGGGGEGVRGGDRYQNSGAELNAHLVLTNASLAAQNYHAYAPAPPPPQQQVASNEQKNVSVTHQNHEVGDVERSGEYYGMRHGRTNVLSPLGQDQTQPELHVQYANSVIELQDNSVPMTVTASPQRVPVSSPHNTATSSPHRVGVTSPRTKMSGPHTAEASCPNSNTSEPDVPDVQTSVVRQDHRRSISGAENDLETVKKGTPLYGQPSWWGEEETESDQADDQYNEDHVDSGNKSEAQLSNGIDSTAVVDDPPTTDHRSEVQHQKPTYMEISQKSVDSAELDQNGHSSPTNDGEKSSPPADGNTSLNASGFAFTVEFGSEGDDAKKLQMNESLSKFLPHKVRRSFRERQAKSVPREKEEDTSLMREKIEEKETSSSVSRHKKTDETTVSGKPPKSPRSSTSTSKQVGYLSDGNHEVLSASDENEDISVRSDIVTSAEKINKRQAAGRAPLKQKLKIDKATPDSKSAKTTANVAQQKSITSTTKYKQRSLSASGSRPTQKSVQQKTTNPPKDGATGQREPSPSSTKNSGPSAYLIDKMFENGQPSRHKKDIEYEHYTGMKSYDRSPAKSSTSIPTSPRGTGVTVSKPCKTGTQTTSKTRTKSPKHRATEDHNGDVVEDNTDKVSESGTYTIGSEGPSRELEEARRSIDQVFGVPSDDHGYEGDHSLSYSRPVITDDLADVNEEGESGDDVGELPSDSMDVEVGTHTDRLSDGASPLPTSDAPKWVTQWASLTSQKSGSKDQDGVPDTVLVSSRDKLELKSGSGRQVGTGNKRANSTRRKLPTPPANESPRSDELNTSNSPNMNVTPLRGHLIKAPVKTLAKDLAEPDSSSEVSNQLSHRETRKMLTNRSTGSVDTAVLLQDTEQVMAAIAARGGNSSKRTTTSGRLHRKSVGSESSKSMDFANNGEDYCSDSDTSSTAAVVNSKNRAAKPYLTQVQQNHNNTRTDPSIKKPPRSASGRNETRPVSTKEKVLMHLASRSGQTHKQFYSPSDPGDAAFECISESDYAPSDTASLYSNNTEMSESSPKLGRKGSQGKGAIAMTRPNRAFALRRARLEAEAAGSGSKPELSDVSSTPRSTASRTVTRPASAGRERSTGRDRSTDRRRPSSAKAGPDSARSLGAEIVRKSQDNMRAEREKSLTRADGGRYSLRETRSSSVSSVTSNISTTSSRPVDLKSVKSKLKSPSKTSSSMRVTGTSTGVQSQPVSRSSSPKSQEYSAWKRRKDYNPRKAVAESSKAKAKASSTNKSARPPLRKAQSLVDNSAHQERLRLNSSFSSVSSEESSYYDPGMSQIPERDMSHSQEIAKVSNELARDLDNLCRSADLQEMQTDRSQANNSLRSMLSSSSDRSSAFSAVAPSKSPSPLRSPSPIPTPRRHALKAREMRAKDGVSKRKEWDKNESYDTLIVSSIYHLSLKLKTSTDRLIDKLREQHQLSGTPTPIDDLMNEPLDSEIPAWKTANQELAGILRNMRRVEHHLQVVDKALFPTTDSGPDGGSSSRAARQQYMKEIERIRKEIVGFKPIDKPVASQSWIGGSEGSEAGSEAGEFAGDEYY